MFSFIGSIFNTVFYQPLYNVLVSLLSIPYVDAGIAAVILTIVVKLIILPLSVSAARSQLLMREIQKPMEEIKEKYKDDREQQALKMLELYKENKLNPFSGILVLLIQLPIIFALYFIFLKGLPVIQIDQLYSFVKAPEVVQHYFLGFIDVTASQNWVLAGLTAITQFIQARIMMPKVEGLKKPGESMKDDFTRSMSIQVKYVLPVFIFFVSYGLIAVVSVYWITSNLFAIVQDIYIKKKLKSEDRSSTETDHSY